MRKKRAPEQSDEPSLPSTLYLIGTGFSKGVCPRVPLNKELLPELIKCTHSPELAEYSALYPTDDIEELLTWLDMKISKCGRIGEARKRINTALADYFSQFRFSGVCHSSKKWLERFAKEVLQPNDAIVSLNYDCLLEGALDHFHVWTPNGGYSECMGNQFEGFSIPINPQGIRLHKIHGSVNFHGNMLLPRKEHKDNGPIILLAVDNRFFSFSCERVSINENTGAPSYIIAPSFVKVHGFDTSRIMIEVLSVAKDANTLVVIGCSLRPEDPFLKLLLLSLFPGKQSPFKRLIIVDPRADDIIAEINKFWIENIGCSLDVRKISGHIQDNIDELIKALKPSDFVAP